MNRDLLRDLAFGLGIELNDEKVGRFEEFEAKLYEFNEVMNLTRVPREECVVRHFVDSLLLPILGSSLLDLGTGPGFPAWPIGCAYPSLRVTAMDSSSKMIGFLQKLPLPNLTAVQERAEDSRWNERFDQVTGRAVAPLALQLELSARPCKLGGTVIPMRTPSDEPEIRRLSNVLGLELEEILTKPLPTTDIFRVFPVYRKTKPTPRGYPRAWAEIKRKPL